MHNPIKMFGCSVDELKEKEVINVCDGRKLGYICDLTVDTCTGRIISIIVPGDMKVFSFKTVSYTHLDVYKRQAMDTTPWLLSWPRTRSARYEPACPI